ncbi:MAG: hypothetical protein AAFS10_09015 [Myxococcota bacterium]
MPPSSPHVQRSDIVQIVDALCIALLLTVAIPLGTAFMVTPEALDTGALGWVPDCPSRLAGTTCALCGMSHAFAAMASGQVALARSFNAHGPLLFTLFCLTAVACMAGLMLNRRRSRPS